MSVISKSKSILIGTTLFSILATCGMDPIVSREEFTPTASQLAQAKQRIAGGSSDYNSFSFDTTYGRTINRQNSVEHIICGRFGGADGYNFAYGLEDGDLVTVSNNPSSPRGHSDAGRFHSSCKRT